MKTAIVTGGAGFIGRHLVNELVVKNWKVRVVDSGVTGRLDLLPSNVDVVVRDIGSMSIRDWVAIIEEGATVFHLAAQKHNTPNVSPAELVQANVTATWNLAKASAAKDVERLVFTSSLYAHGGLGPADLTESSEPNPRTLYGISKLAGENIIRALGETSGLSWNCARLFFTYGPGQFSEGGYKSVIVKSFENLRMGQPIVRNGSGEQILDYIYVSDVVSALLELADSDHESEVVNVSTGNGVSVNALLSTIVGVAQDREVAIVGAEADWTEGTRRVGDTTHAERVLKWRPQTDIATGLTLTWEAFDG